MSAPLLELSDLIVRYPLGAPGILGRSGRPVVHAVEGLSLTVQAGEIVALVGESGCGKSTVARTIVGLQHASGGRVIFDGIDIAGLRGADLRPYRRAIQLVHQDPYDALDPRLTVRAIVEEGLRIHLRSLRHQQQRHDRRSLVDGVLEALYIGSSWPMHHHQINLASAQALEHRFEAIKAKPLIGWAAQPKAHLLGLSSIVIEDGNTHGAETGLGGFRAERLCY